MQNNKHCHKVFVGLSPQVEILNSKCSCTECDSVDCFVKRRAPCPCRTTDHKTCLLHIKKSKLSLKSNNIKNTEERHVAGVVLERISKEQHVKKKVISILHKNSSKKLSRTNSDKIVNSKDTKKEEPADDSRKGISERTAKLTAQIMNLPYKDFQKSVSKSNVPNVTILSPFDIFNRIKKAYKACSCKVCECIGGKSLQNDLCRCKPCDCNECSGFNRQGKFKEPGKLPIDDEARCPCIKCNKGSCKAIEKWNKTSLQDCNCVGSQKCEYLTNLDNIIVQDCNKLVHSFTEIGRVFRDEKGCPCIRCKKGTCKAIGQGIIKSEQECDCAGSQLKREYYKNDDSLIQYNQELVHYLTDDGRVPREDGRGNLCTRCNRGSCNAIREGKSKYESDCAGSQIKYEHIKQKYNVQASDKLNNYTEAPNEDEGCPYNRCNSGSCKTIGQGKKKSAQKCDCTGSQLKCDYLKNLDKVVQRSDKLLQIRTDDLRIPKDEDSGCPCIRCNRGSCKAIGQGKKKSAQCDCVGLLKCEYIKNLDNLVENCNCEPCECMECRPASIHRQREVIVAPVGDEYTHRNVCQCSPCECFECGNNSYGFSPNLHHEMSTSVNRHPNCHCETCLNEACIPDDNQTCRCERQSKVMSKPFQQDSHDYDIRRATVTYDDTWRYKDTITMFAAVNNLYPKLKASNNQCDCEPCECLVCKNEETTAHTSKVSNSTQNYKQINEINDCKCSLCECIFCTKHDNKPQNHKKECKNVDLLASPYVELNKHESKKAKSTFSAKQEYKYKFCGCSECEKLTNTCFGDICQCSNGQFKNCNKETYSDEVIYPVKRGEPMTPSMYRKKIKDAFFESCVNTLEAHDEIMKRSAILSPSLKKPSVFNPVQTVKTAKDEYNNVGTSRKCLQENLNRLFPQNFITLSESQGQILKSPNNTNLLSRNFGDTLETKLSANSSMSFVKESGSITPPKCKLKSWESSCNSSGHDCPSYLIHFPKTSIDTDLNDEMLLDTENNTNLATIDLSLENDVRKQHFSAKFSKSQLMRSVFFGEKPKSNIDGASESEEGNYFKYSSQNFEGNPYRPQNSEVTAKDDVIKEKRANLITEESFPTIFEKSCTFATNSKNCFIIDKDYESVQSTLIETRAFSAKLVKLLEKYEKANREFESVSEKIMKSHGASFSLNNNNTPKHDRIESNLEDLFDMDVVPTKGKDIENLSRTSTEELVEINKEIVNTYPTDLLTDLSREGGYNSEDQVDENNFNSSTTNKTCDDNNEGRDESGDNIIKINHDFLRTITEEKEPIDVNKQEEQERVAKQVHNRYNQEFKSFLICPERKTNFANTSSVSIEDTIEKNTNQANGNPILKKNNSYRARNIIDKDIKKDFNTGRTPKIEVVNLLKDITKSATELRASASEKKTKEDCNLQKDVVMIKQPMIEHNKDINDFKGEKWTILKKNVCLGTFNRRDLLPSLSLLEQNIKVVSETISKQPISENATYIIQNKALVKLQTEVNKLLRMPILQTLEGSTSEQQKRMGKPNQFCILSKTSSSQTFNQEFRQAELRRNFVKNAYITAECSKPTQNTCDAMKVNFLTVRRVSDHTVLVKWNTPRVISNVEGYELLVDGRAVQKIMSPSRCIAVVTCLPHSDKVLLTVRTVLYSLRYPAHTPEHSPAVTVIYQPKGK